MPSHNNIIVLMMITPEVVEGFYLKLQLLGKNMENKQSRKGVNLPF